MKKNKRTLFSLNKTNISSLNHLSKIIGGIETVNCETYQENICLCGETLSCKSSAYAPPTGFDNELILQNPPTQTNGFPGNDCC